MFLGNGERKPLRLPRRPRILLGICGSTVCINSLLLLLSPHSISLLSIKLKDIDKQKQNLLINFITLFTLLLIFLNFFIELLMVQQKYNFILFELLLVFACLFMCIFFFLLSMKQWKRVLVLLMLLWGGLLREQKFLQKVAMRRSLDKLFRLYRRNNSWKHMHATYPPLLDPWWESCICQRQSWHFVVITHFLTKRVTRLNGAIIR